MEFFFLSSTKLLSKKDLVLTILILLRYLKIITKLLHAYIYSSLPYTLSYIRRTVSTIYGLFLNKYKTYHVLYPFYGNVPYRNSHSASSKKKSS